MGNMGVDKEYLIGRAAREIEGLTKLIMLLNTDDRDGANRMIAEHNGAWRLPLVRV